MLKKIILGIILLVLFISPAFAQETLFYVINDFSKGLNSQASAYLVDKNQGIECLNVRINEVYGALSKRPTLLEDGSTGSAAVTSIHKYYLSDGTSHTLATTGTYLKRVISGTDVILKAILTDGKRWSWVTFKDLAIGMNGYDEAIKYDGHTLITANTDAARTAENLCAELGAPFAELNTGTALEASKWYQYRVVYYDDTNYDYCTARSNAIQTGADVHNIYLTGIPIGPSGTTARYIYRTAANVSKTTVEADDTFYYVDVISDNSTEVYADAVSDATLTGDRAPTWATVSTTTEEDVTPPTASLCIIHGDRVFVAGNTTYLSSLYYSEYLRPDYFKETHYEDIRPDDGDNITGLAEQQGMLCVFKTNSIQKYYTEGESVTSWYPSDVYSHVGCPAPFTVTNTPSGIAYLSRRGWFLFDGQNIQLISDAVTPEIRDISQANIDNCFAHYNDKKLYLAYPSTSSGSTINNRVLVYDFVRDSYVVDDVDANCFETFNAGDDSGELYVGDSTTNGYIFAYGVSNVYLDQLYKSEFDAGTYDDMRTRGTENDPIVELGRVTIDELTGTIDNLTGIIDREDTDGTWISPVFQINASGLQKLYWNENLGAYGDVNMYVRTGATTAACASASWSAAYTNPNGADISGVTANTYIQIKAALSTDSIYYTPELIRIGNYVARIAYLEIGSAYETSILSIWESGWNEFEIPGYEKRLKRIKVFYQGTENVMTFSYKNDSGDVDSSFEIDLSVDPDDDLNDNITGTDNYKIYTHYPPINSDTVNTAIGQLWTYHTEEDGTEYWQIDKIETAFTIEPLNL